MFPSPSTNAGRNRPADTSPFCCRKGRPMLQLINIEKKYTTGDLTQAALNGVSLNLRDSEFVAILGPSGSGKTTLLNIIGGLDRYDLLLVIANQGYTGSIMDAARAAGAGGGTVIHAKGTGMEGAARFMGIDLVNEKELVLIVSRTSEKNAIMKAIMDNADKKAGSIVFSLPVTDTAGLRLLDEE